MTSQLVGVKVLKTIITLELEEISKIGHIPRFGCSFIRKKLNVSCYAHFIIIEGTNWLEKYTGESLM